MHIAQVLVRWALQHGTAVVPRASGEAHLRSNLGALDWELPPEDFQALSSFEFQAGGTLAISPNHQGSLAGSSTEEGWGLLLLLSCCSACL